MLLLLIIKFVKVASGLFVYVSATRVETIVKLAIALLMFSKAQAAAV